MNLINFIKNNKWIIAIIALSIAIRLVYLFVLDPPLLWSDSSQYDGAAWNLAQGNGYSMGDIPFVGREPGYALFFLTPIYFIFGHSIFAAQIFQILISAGIVYLTFLFGKKFFTRKIGLLSALFFAIYPATIAYSSEILTEIPFAFLFMLSILTLFLGIKKNSKKSIFISGLFLGTATLTRFITIFFPIFTIPIFYILFKSWKKTFVFSGLLVLAMMLFVSPWIIRNYAQFDTFVFGRTGGGNPYWSGSYEPWDGEHLFGRLPMPENIQKELEEAKPDPNNFKGDEILTKYAIINIKENPLGVAKIWLKKPLKIFFLRKEFSTFNKVETLSWSGCLAGKDFRTCPVVEVLRITHIIIMLIAIYGWIILFRKKERFITIIFLFTFLYFVIFYLPMNPDVRYRFHLLPYIFLLASVGIFNIIDLIKEKYAKR